MGKDASVVPKGTLTLSKIGKGFGKESVLPAANTTFKLRKGPLNASLLASDQTFRSVNNAKGLKDVVATADWKVPKVKGITLNSKYELGTKKYTAGATWDGLVKGKAATLKSTYSNKDNKFAGEATVSIDRYQKANLVFNQDRLISSKYTMVKDSFTFEPSYNFDKKAPALAVSKKQGKYNVFKVTYDLKSEAAALEFFRKPLKLTVSSTVGKAGVSRPTLSAIFENTYDF